MTGRPAGLAGTGQNFDLFGQNYQSGKNMFLSSPPKKHVNMFLTINMFKMFEESITCNAFDTNGHQNVIRGSKPPRRIRLKKIFDALTLILMPFLQNSQPPSPRPHKQDLPTPPPHHPGHYEAT